MPCSTLPGDSCQHRENRNLLVDRNRSQGVQGETIFLGDSEWKVKTPGCTREESKPRTHSPSPRTAAPHPSTAWNHPRVATTTTFWPRRERRKHPERETDKQAVEVRMRWGAWPQARPAQPGPPSSKFRKLLYLAGERQGLRNPTSAARALEERGDWADGVPSGYRHPGPGLASPLRGREEPRDPAELPCPCPQHRHRQRLLRFG